MLNSAGVCSLLRTLYSRSVECCGSLFIIVALGNNTHYFYMRQNEPIQYNPLYTRCENRCGLFFIVATHYSAASFTEPAFPSLFIPIIQPCRLVDRHILRHAPFYFSLPQRKPFPHSFIDVGFCLK